MTKPRSPFDANAPRRFLGGLSSEQFLTRHWQKAPLLVRSAVPRLPSAVSRDALLGLARRNDVEARLVGVQGDTWSLEHGPLPRAMLSKLPARDWTVLVSDLEQHLPAAAPLLQHLDFLPSWRVDDVMASFATPGGSVGPHFDSYDVFLLQVHGRRRWQIAERFDRSAVRDDTPLCILEHFEPEQEWLLEPGDMLYLPPQVAHYGVAETAAITCSLGCRAPSLKELATHFALRAIDRCEPGPFVTRRPEVKHDRFSLAPELSRDVAPVLQNLFTFDSETCLRGLASLVTEPKALFALDVEETPSAATVRRRCSGQHALRRRPGSRWLLLAQGTEPYLYVDGEEYACRDGGAFATELARQVALPTARIRRALRSPTEAALLTALVARGQLVPQIQRSTR